MLKNRQPDVYQHAIDCSEGLEEVLFYGTFTSMLLTFCIYEVDCDTAEEYLQEANLAEPPNLRLWILRRHGDVMTRLIQEGPTFLTNFIINMIGHP